MSQRTLEFLRSSKFFWLVVTIFVVQAAWIALSGRYPMAFDEEFHLGVIELYADQLGPFMATQPENADRFQAVFRDPSYLYHYLMSFPYRLIDLFTDSQTVKILLLRGINITLFAGGLVLFRRLLSKAGISSAIVNLSLLVLVLLPVTPLLAAQINYDNLLIPLTAIILLLTVKFSTKLTITKKIDIKTLLVIAIVGLLGSLVKFAFLPIFLAAVIYILFKIWRLGALRWQLRPLNSWTLLALVIFVIAGGLFFERYGLNTIRYGSPIPDCAQVLSIEQCSKSGVWIRDYKYAQNKGPTSPFSPLVYVWEWFYGMWLRSFFAVAGPDVRYQARGPLIMPAVGAIIFAAIGLAAFILSISRLLKIYNRDVIWLFITATGVYLLVLWLNGFQDFVQTGQPVAINGRYLLPVLPLVIALFAVAVADLLKRQPNLKRAMAIAPIICLLWGGGALTYILRSNDSWYWDNEVVRDANHAVQRVIGPITPGYHNPKQFLR